MGTNVSKSILINIHTILKTIYEHNNSGSKIAYIGRSNIIAVIRYLNEIGINVTTRHPNGNIKTKKEIINSILVSIYFALPSIITYDAYLSQEGKKYYSSLIMDLLIRIQTSIQADEIIYDTIRGGATENQIIIKRLIRDIYNSGSQVGTINRLGTGELTYRIVNFTIQNVPGDGHCMFHAIAHQIVINKEIPRCQELLSMLKYLLAFNVLEISPETINDEKFYSILYLLLRYIPDIPLYEDIRGRQTIKYGDRTDLINLVTNSILGDFVSFVIFTDVLEENIQYINKYVCQVEQDYIMGFSGKSDIDKFLTDVLLLIPIRIKMQIQIREGRQYLISHYESVLRYEYIVTRGLNLVILAQNYDTPDETNYEIDIFYIDEREGGFRHFTSKFIEYGEPFLYIAQFNNLENRKYYMSLRKVKVVGGIEKRQEVRLDILSDDYEYIEPQGLAIREVPYRFIYEIRKPLTQNTRINVVLSNTDMVNIIDFRNININYTSVENTFGLMQIFPFLNLELYRAEYRQNYERVKKYITDTRISFLSRAIGARPSISPEKSFIEQVARIEEITPKIMVQEILEETKIYLQLEFSTLPGTTNIRQLEINYNELGSVDKYEADGIPERVQDSIKYTFLIYIALGKFYYMKFKQNVVLSVSDTREFQSTEDGFLLNITRQVEKLYAGIILS